MPATDRTTMRRDLKDMGGKLAWAFPKTKKKEEKRGNPPLKRHRQRESGWGGGGCYTANANDTSGSEVGAIAVVPCPPCAMCAIRRVAPGLVPG